MHWDVSVPKLLQVPLRCAGWMVAGEREREEEREREAAAGSASLRYIFLSVSIAVPLVPSAAVVAPPPPSFLAETFSLKAQKEGGEEGSCPGGARGFENAGDRGPLRAGGR